MAGARMAGGIFDCARRTEVGLFGVQADVAAQIRAEQQAGELGMVWMGQMESPA
jgi:hypothetical protein